MVTAFAYTFPSSHALTLVSDQTQKTTVNHEPFDQKPSLPLLGLAASPTDDRVQGSIQSLCNQGQLDRALDVLLTFKHSQPSIDACWPVLAECTKQKSLPHAKALHKLLAFHGLESCGPVGDHLIISLIKCGGLPDSLQLFHRLPYRTVFSWTAALSGYTDNGQCLTAVSTYKCMQKEGVEPNAYTIVTLLKACGSLCDLVLGRELHAYAQWKELHSHDFVGNSLLSMYAKCGSIGEAEKVFSQLSGLDIISWNLMLSAYINQGEGPKALRLYRQMQKEAASPNKRTYVLAIQACGLLSKEGLIDEELTYEIVQALHADVKRKGHDSDIGIGSTLILMYGKVGDIARAEVVFAGLCHWDAVSWNVMLSAYILFGDVELALQLHKRMQVEGISPTDRSFVMVLQACYMLAETQEGAFVGEGVLKAASLEIGRALHKDARHANFDSDVFVGSNVIAMYGKCGSILEAENVFTGLSTRNIVSWTVMLSAYVDQGEGEKTLLLYRQMLEEGMMCDEQAFAIILQACCILAENEGPLFEIGCAIHADVRKMDFDSNVFVSSALISLYSRCRKFLELSSFLGNLSLCDAASWNRVLLAYLQEGKAKEVLQLFAFMHGEGMRPADETFTIVVKACCMLGESRESVKEGEVIKVKVWEIGKAIHNDIQVQHVESNLFVSSALITMYTKLGSLKEAENVFWTLPNANFIPWTAMVSAYAEQGKGDKVLQLHRELIETGSLTKRHLVVAFQACCTLADKGAKKDETSQVLSLQIGRELHTDACKVGCESDGLVCSAILNVYIKCGEVATALDVFEQLHKPELVMWNEMLWAFVDQGMEAEACQFFKRMQIDGSGLNKQTFLAILRACCMLAEKDMAPVVEEHSKKVFALETCLTVHADAVRMGFDCDGLISNVLMNVYGKCRSLIEAENLFSLLFQPDIVSGNVMLSAYDEHGEGEKALQLFSQMHKEQMVPDARSFAIIMHACSELGRHSALEAGQLTPLMLLEIKEALHADARKKHFDIDVFVGSNLVSMYGVCGHILEAERVFNRLSCHDIILWNSLLTVYLEHGDGEKALQTYKQMHVEGISPNLVTVVIVLQACHMLSTIGGVVDKELTKVVSLEIGKALYADVRTKGLDLDATVGSALVSMFRRCGSIEEAEIVFSRFSELDVVLCNEMLAAYVKNGQEEAALHLYWKMQDACSAANYLTFIYALKALSRIGNVGVCRHIHYVVVLSGYDRDAHLGTTLIHAYGNCASMLDAQAVFDTLPSFDAVSFTALLGGHARDGNCVATMQIFENMRLAGIKPTGATFVALFHACSHAGLVDEGVKFFEAMTKDYGLSPELEHYACVLDLLGRAGNFVTMRDMFVKMQVQPDFAMVLGLMGACQKHGNVHLEKEFFDYAMHLQPKEAGTLC